MKVKLLKRFGNYETGGKVATPRPLSSVSGDFAMNHELLAMNEGSRIRQSKGSRIRQSEDSRVQGFDNQRVQGFKDSSGFNALDPCLLLLISQIILHICNVAL